MDIDITGKLGEYLREYCTEYLKEHSDLEENGDTYGKLRELAYAEMENLFGDAMDYFSMSDLQDDASDSINKEIKELLFEMNSDYCDYKRKNEIDDEIQKLEDRKEKIISLEE